MNGSRLNVLELFAGIGGMSLGLQRAGMRIVGHVEINPFCRAVLRKHWPEVPSHDDVRTAAAWWRSRPRPRVDVVAGGYPCQGESTAGKRLGDADPRWLWPAMADVVYALRPRYVIGENVLGHRTRGLSRVLADLADLGYTARAGVVRACEMGAPHPRARLFVLAHAQSSRRTPRWAQPGWTGPTPRTDQERCEPSRSGRWAAEPGVDRVAYGLPDRVDRLTALGNAVVPAVAEHIGRIVLDHHEGR
ncbi:DNA (cytosine-5-)-methyltransferase [Micromonospora sp. WMMA1996]|uniref:DNA cytosine methyltransferase n=1 Tax=Micromonospora sp. WMMA1996 TaxID=2039878 RepID=UPI000BF3CCA1|nr:DNA cytosine methyltransferase [Micromonospora sp. WMMA1996]PGH42404.1 DNA (cytosine-5-)-methyltransferase [Micromonospora sp. WMMA1996]